MAHWQAIAAAGTYTTHYVSYADPRVVAIRAS